MAQHRHGKTLLRLAASSAWLDQAGVAATLPDGRPDPGVFTGTDVDEALTEFIAALGRHRQPEREAR
ncbi:hypothetical protein [uncultured Piscinibacter sp.]|mgnify:CR=1 FL=1|uniref:hypothetical protein n=1 Tax=uncultured Piscinibacter sp. TaxID=1131835 RepID=UPI00260F69B0|nr:hypothetical protein [uncultured Piscinibacter sp.]